MKLPIDIKSALLGLCLGVVAMLAIGASSPASTTPGRYQLGGTASHGLVIDTATGRVWSAYLPQMSGKTDGDFWKEKTINQK